MPDLKDNYTRNRNVRWVYVVLITITLIGVYVNYSLAQFFKVFKLEESDHTEALSKINNLQMLTSIMGLVQITGFVLLLVWIYRAYENALKLDDNSMSTTPGWAVGGFFIPLYNLYAGYKVVSEIWNLYSEKSKDPDPLAIEQTTEIPTFSLPLTWWIFFLLTAFIANFNSRYFDNAEYITASPYNHAVVENLIYALYLFIAIYMLKKFEHMETETYARHHQRDLMEHLTAE